MLLCWFKENFTSWERKWITVSAPRCKYCTKQYINSPVNNAEANPLSNNWAGPKIPFAFGFHSVFPSALKMVATGC